MDASQGSSSATTTAINGLPLITCPRCGGDEPLLLLTSKTETNPGKVFMKYEKNQKGEKRRRCSFFMWLEDYVEYLREIGVLERVKEKDDVLNGTGKMVQDGSKKEEGNREEILCNEALKLELTALNAKMGKLIKLQEIQMGLFLVFFVVFLLAVLGK